MNSLFQVGISWGKPRFCWFPQRQSPRRPWPAPRSIGPQWGPCTPWSYPGRCRVSKINSEKIQLSLGRLIAGNCTVGIYFSKTVIAMPMQLDEKQRASRANSIQLTPDAIFSQSFEKREEEVKGRLRIRTTHFKAKRQRTHTLMWTWKSRRWSPGSLQRGDRAKEFSSALEVIVVCYLQNFTQNFEFSFGCLMILRFFIYFCWMS